MYCWEWACISFWNLGIAQLYHIYGKWGGLQITIAPLTFTFLGWTVRNCAIINTVSKSATNPKEDAKLLQSGWASSDPYWNLFIPEMGYLQPSCTGSKTQGRVKKRKLPFQHQYLSCVFLFSFPQLSLLIPSPWWKTVSISLNLSPPFLKEMRGSRRKKREREEKRERKRQRGHIKVSYISTSFILQESTCFNLPWAIHRHCEGCILSTKLKK